MEIKTTRHSSTAAPSTLGIVGFGAFGRLLAEHLSPYFRIFACDASPPSSVPAGVTFADLREVCRCDIVVIAVGLADLTDLCRAMAAWLVPGTIVMDVCSTKVAPAEIMLRELPKSVDLIATHPMFGPQSILQGTLGLKMVICPLRGRSAWRISAFLRSRFGLSILFATPEEHDREAAFTQGLTHLIANALLRMDCKPGRITTKSFDLIQQAVDMVRDDAPRVSHAIASNPHARSARETFSAQMNAICRELAPDYP